MNICFALACVVKPNVSPVIATVDVHAFGAQPLLAVYCFPDRILIKIHIERLGQVVSTGLCNLGTNSRAFIKLFVLNLLLFMVYLLHRAHEVALNLAFLIPNWSIRLNCVVVLFSLHASLFTCEVGSINHP